MRRKREEEEEKEEEHGLQEGEVSVLNKMAKWVTLTLHGWLQCPAAFSFIAGKAEERE